MKRIRRDTLYTDSSSLELRVQQLERRIYPRINYGGIPLDDVAIAATGITQITVSGTTVFGPDVSSFRVAQQGLQYTDVSTGGFFQVLAGIDLAAARVGKLQVFWEDYDSDGNLVGTAQPSWVTEPLPEADARTDPAGTQYWRTSAFFINSGSLDGYATFTVWFNNQGAATTASGVSLIVIRLADAGDDLGADGV